MEISHLMICIFHLAEILTRMPFNDPGLGARAGSCGPLWHRYLLISAVYKSNNTRTSLTENTVLFCQITKLPNHHKHTVAERSSSGSGAEVEPVTQSETKPGNTRLCNWLTSGASLNWLTGSYCLFSSCCLFSLTGSTKPALLPIASWGCHQKQISPHRPPI